MNKKIFLLLVFLSSLLVIDPFLHSGIFRAHDMPSNLTYFGAFYSSLLEGNIFPRWGGNIANLYGSPTIMFFYPMSYYLTSIFRLFGFSLIDSTKLFIFVSFILSAIFFYSWIKNHVSHLLALMGGVLYVYAPYRITDIYSRASIAENTAFVFIPLVSLGIYKIHKSPSVGNVLFLSIAIALLILSHPFMLIVFLPFYILYNFCFKMTLNKILKLGFACLWAFLITAFYVIPLLVENKYTHYDMSPFRGVDYHEQFLSIKKLLLPQWNFIDIYGTLEYQTYQIGLLQIALFIIGLSIYAIFLRKVSKNTTLKKLINLSIISTLLAVFFTLSISNPIYKVFPLLQRIEYPWRFLSLVIFSVAFLTPLAISLLQQKIHKWILIFIVFSAVILYLPYSKGHDYLEQSDEHYLYDIRINTDGFATLPIWAAQPDKYPRISNRYEVIEGDVTVTPLLRTSTRHIYDIEAKTQSKIADDTFYFPGWNVYLDGKQQQIQFQDPNYRGIITFDIPIGRHYIEVVFRNTKIRWVADLISITALVLFIGIHLNEKKNKKTVYRNSGL